MNWPKESGMAAGARTSIGAQRSPASEKAILDAARELLAEKGLAGFSIEAVARRARAGKPTIYRWWPDKTRLLLAVYATIKQELAEPDTGSLEGDVAGFLRNVIGFWRDTGAGVIFRSVLAESQGDAAAHEALVTYHAGRRQRTAALFARDHGDGAALTAEEAGDLAELAADYALTQLAMGTLDIAEAEILRIARRLVRGARGPAARS